MNKVEKHLKEGKSVCPFANHAGTKEKIKYHTLDISDTDENISNSLMKALAQPRETTVIVKITPPSKNHEKARNTARRIKELIVTGYNDSELFIIAQNPLYPPNHPRYAPEEVIVVTDQSEFEKLREKEKTVNLIKLNAQKRAAEAIEDSATVAWLENYIAQFNNNTLPPGTDVQNTLYYLGKETTKYLGTKLYEYPPETQ